MFFPEPAKKRFYRLLSLSVALLFAALSGRTPAFGAFLENHAPVTYNMQGATAGNLDKWNNDVLPLSNTHDVVAVQEAGSAPPGTITTQYNTPQGTFTETLWNVGTNSRPNLRYIYFLETDPTGHRVNLAIVLRAPADESTTIPAGLANSRGALGVRIGLMWFFTIHGLSGGGNDDAGLLRNIESANLSGLFWAALGDYNRDPATLTVPADAHIYSSGQSTQQSGGELDYMVSNDVVTCPPENIQVTGRRLGGLSSDHYPVDFPVTSCPGGGDTATAALTLMPVGDQITVGLAEANIPNSYRGDLQNDLSGEGLSWNFVGTQQSGDLADSFHEGYNSSTISAIDAHVYGTVEMLKPNLITLLAGWEDILRNDRVDTAPLRLTNLIEDIFTADPGVTVLVATLPNNPSNQAAISTFNKALPGVVQHEQQHGRHVLLADMGSLVAGTDVDSNSVRPSGYQKMADSFNQTLLEAVTLGWLAHPVPCGSGPCGPSGGGNGGGGNGGSGSGGGGSCDIYASGGTPCVAAHSTVRALFSGYNGRLYQVRRASDSSSIDIKTSSMGGYADAGAQDTFCAGTSCTITIIYDQSSLSNDLAIEGPGGAAPHPDSGAVADALPISVNGHAVYGVKVTPGVGYRNNATSGVAKGGSPEGMYMVTSGKNVNDQCCFDYGNAEANSLDTGNGHMDALNFGTACIFGPCSGSGPWVEADLENGQYMGNGSNLGNQSINNDFVTAMLKNNGQTTFALKGGNAQSGGLTTEYSGTLPTINPGYIPMHLEGGIVLGTGGDNSDGGVGSFFEGAMTSGYPSDAVESQVQSNIVAAGYSGDSVGKGGSGSSGSSGDHPDNGGSVYTGPNDPGGPGPQDGFASPAIQQPNIFMGSKPALASFNGNLYVAFQANDPGHTLHVTSSVDGQSWPAAAQVPNVAIGSAPAMAVFNGKLYIAFRADDPSNDVWIASSSDGVHFSSQVLSGQSMGGSSSPALVVSNNTLYYIYGADDTSNEMLVTTSTDGATWQGPAAYLDVKMGAAGPGAAAFGDGIYVGLQTVDSRNALYVTHKATEPSVYTGPNDPGGPGPQDGFLSPAALKPNISMGSKPALTTYNGNLYVAFQANDAGHALHVTSSSDGRTFPPAPQVPNVAIGSSPSMAGFNGKLFIAFQANDPVHELWITSSSDGSSFTSATGFPDVLMGSAPAMVAFNNALYVAFQANDPGHSLHVTSSPDGQNFPPAAQVPNVTIGSAPAMAVFNGILYVAFRADDPGNAVWIASSSDGIHFSSQLLAGQKMGENSSPALTVANGTLYCIYGADDISNEMLVMASTDGTTWQGPAAYLNVKMGAAGPGAASFAGPIGRGGISSRSDGVAVGFQSNDARKILFVTGKVGR